MYYLGCFTTHILGRHYAHVYRAGREIMAVEYGKDYYNALAYVQHLNRSNIY